MKFLFALATLFLVSVSNAQDTTPVTITADGSYFLGPNKTFSNISIQWRTGTGSLVLDGCVATPKGGITTVGSGTTTQVFLNSVNPAAFGTSPPACTSGNCNWLNVPPCWSYRVTMSTCSNCSVVVQSMSQY